MRRSSSIRYLSTVTGETCFTDPSLSLRENARGPGRSARVRYGRDEHQLCEVPWKELWGVRWVTTDNAQMSGRNTGGQGRSLGPFLSRNHCSGHSPTTVVSTLALSAMREAVCATEARLDLFQTMLALWSRPLERPGRRGGLPREAASSRRDAGGPCRRGTWQAVCSVAQVCQTET
jgi:hypothetical protein